jgi:hypothetical protein
MPEDTNGQQAGAGAQQPAVHYAQNIKPPTALDTESNAAGNWKLWKQKWDIYLTTSGHAGQPNKFISSLLLNQIGDAGLEVYNGMKFVAPYADKEDPDHIVKNLDTHFLGKTKEFFERFKFNSRDQENDESIDMYTAALRNLGKTCGFCDCMRDKLLMDRLILGVHNNKSRENLISQGKLDLNSAIDILRGMEAAQRQIKEMQSKNAEEIHKVDKRAFKSRPKPTKWDDSSKFDRSNYDNGQKKRDRDTPLKCKFCGKIHVMRKSECPAWGKKCIACDQPNHFRNSEICKKKNFRPVNAIHTGYYSDTSSAGESISCITADIKAITSPEDHPIYCKMLINKMLVKLQVDCGATVNILPRQYIAESDIRKESVNLRMWNNTAMKALGKSKVKTVNPKTGEKWHVDYVIVEDNLTPLLSRKAAEKMNLITVNYDNFELVRAIHPQTTSTNDFPQVFDGKLGSLPGPKVHLSMEADSKPVIRPPRTHPEAMRVKVKEELDRMEHAGILQRIDKPTDWVNQMSVAEKKSGAIRICLDPRPLNLVMKCEHYRLPVLDDILPQLIGSKVFSVCDLEQGYLHCELDEESSLLTTMATPFGRYNWRRLPYGLTVSAEIFQKKLHQALEGLMGVHCVADDCVVHGENVADHDDKMNKLFHRCTEQGIRLNKQKCKLRLSEIPFLGHIISAEGLKTDPAKIEAVINMATPTCKESVERLKGTVNYLARFVPLLSQVLHPIAQLTHKDVEWNWGPIHDQAFEKVKMLLTEALVLAYFDPKKQLIIQCDASKYGLGAALLQEEKPLAYASRALTDVETRYAVIEKEMLAIIFALEKWHQFTYGRKVIVNSDHKPLESITCKPLDRAPKRLQGMLLRALAYDIEVKYLEGSKMFLADTLSREYLPASSNDQSEFETINAVKFLPMREERIEQIRLATENDPTLESLKATIQHGWPDKKDTPPLVMPYYTIKDELAVTDGLVFRGERLVVPENMRSEIKKDIHMGHTGIEGCLRRARELVYWPGMNSEIKSWIQMCDTCQEYGKSHPKESLLSHEIPERPWQKVGIDLFSYKEKDYLVATDYRSNFWEIDYMTSTAAKAVIKKLKAHFARWGIPDTVVTDCGPQ